MKLIYKINFMEKPKFLLFKKILFIYFSTEGEKQQCVVASLRPPTGDLASNPIMCLGWESNWRPFGSQAVLSPLRHTNQGKLLFNFIVKLQVAGKQDLTFDRMCLHFYHIYLNLLTFF